MVRKKSDNNRSAKTGGKNKPGLSILLYLPLVGGIFICAGAFFMAMVFCLFTLDLEGVRLGAGVLIRGLVDGIFIAIAKTFTLGLPIACCIGFFVTYQERKKTEDWKSEDWVLTPILPIILSLCAIAAILYLAMAMYWVVISALEMSRWGTYIGSALGLLLGCFIAIHDARDRKPARIGKGKKKGKGASFHELDWWMANTDDQDVDAD